MDNHFPVNLTTYNVHVYNAHAYVCTCACMYKHAREREWNHDLLGVLTTQLQTEHNSFKKNQRVDQIF